MIRGGELADRQERVEPQPLTERQAAVLAEIQHYRAATGEPPAMAYVARRLKITREGVRVHIDALCRKGWLRAPGPPLVPRDG